MISLADSSPRPHEMPAAPSQPRVGHATVRPRPPRTAVPRPLPRDSEYTVCGLSWASRADVNLFCQLYDLGTLLDAKKQAQGQHVCEKSWNVTIKSRVLVKPSRVGEFCGTSAVSTVFRRRAHTLMARFKVSKATGARPRRLAARMLDHARAAGALIGLRPQRGWA